MPRIGFSEEYSGGQGTERFPKLKLAEGEKKRVLIYQAVFSEWVHEYRVPKMLDGQPLLKRETKTDGTVVEKADTEWLGNDICLGMDEIMKQAASDPQNCPGCAQAKETPDFTPPAKRRYAMNVVSYKLIGNGQSNQLAQPFGAEVLLWAFTSRNYDKLLAFQREWGPLHTHDFLLGPPEKPIIFQKYNIEICQGAVYNEYPQTKQYINDLVHAPGMSATDDQLRDACGRKVTFAQLQEDVSRALQRWRMASQSGGPVHPQAGAQAFAGQQGMTQGFDSLIGQAAQPMAAPQAQQFAQPAMAAAPQAQGQFMPNGQPPQQFTHPLEQVAAAQSAGEFPVAQPAFMQAQHQQPPPQQQFAPQPPQGYQVPPPGYAQPQQPQAQPQAFSGIQPQPQGYAPSGMDEFAPGTTMNPAQPQALPQQPGPPVQMFPQQHPAQMAQPPQPAAVPGFAPMMQQPPAQPQAPAAAPPGDVSFDAMFDLK